MTWHTDALGIEALIASAATLRFSHENPNAELEKSTDATILSPFAAT